MDDAPCPHSQYDSGLVEAYYTIIDGDGYDDVFKCRQCGATWWVHRDEEEEQ